MFKPSPHVGGAGITTFCGSMKPFFDSKAEAKEVEKDQIRTQNLPAVGQVRNSQVKDQLKTSSL